VTDYTDRLFRGVPKAPPVGGGEFCEILGFFSVNVEDCGLRRCYTVAGNVGYPDRIVAYGDVTL